MLRLALQNVKDGLPIHVRPPDPGNVPENLLYAILHVDAARGPLQPVYCGPYKVLWQLSNTAVLQIGDRH